MCKSFVNGMTLSSIFLTDPISQTRLILADDVHTAISAAAVNDDVFQVRIPLEQHRADGILDELRLVIRWRDDAHPGPGRAIRHSIR